MTDKKSTAAMKKRYARLTAQLGKLGPILQGTISERNIVREDPQRPGKEKTYGPYYQWTWKKSGKTVTVNLSASQAKAFQKAIDNHRKLEDILKEMRDLSLRILDNETVGVRKRKSKLER